MNVTAKFMYVATVMYHHVAYVKVECDNFDIKRLYDELMT